MTYIYLPFLTILIASESIGTWDDRRRWAISSDKLFGDWIGEGKGESSDG